MTVELDIDPGSGTARLWLNRAESLNSLNESTRLRLLQAIDETSRSASARVLVIQGRGRAFCVGQDLDAAEELVDAGATVRDTYNPLVDRLTRMPKPVVAAVNGPAVGAGMGLALACDVVVMSTEAFYSCAFSQVALVPDTGTSLALARTVGYLRAYEIASSARRVSAPEALSLGLATELVDPDMFDEAVNKHAQALAAAPATSSALTKQLLRSVDAQTLALSIADEAQYQGVAAADADHAEGVRAFRERRSPQFGMSPENS